jgi:hypothetical protein
MRRFVLVGFALVAGFGIGHVVRPAATDRATDRPVAVEVIRANPDDPQCGRYTPFHVSDRVHKVRLHTDAVDESRMFVFRVRYADGSVLMIHTTRD